MGYRRNRHAAEDDMVRSVPDWVLFKRMVGYIVAQRKESLTLVLAITVASIINLIPPYLATLAIDRYIIVNDPEGLTVLSVILIVTYALIFTSRYVQRFLISWLGAQLDRNMRQDIFSHLQRLSLTFYAKREVGSIVSRATNDIDKITELITSGVANVVADILTLVGIIIIMLSMNWWLSLITFSIIPLMLIFLYIWGRRVRKVYRETRKTIASVSAKMEESVSGMKEIQSFSKEGATRQEFRQINQNNMQANVQAGQVMSAFWPAVSIFTAVGNFLVLWFGGNAVMDGTLSVGLLFGFMSYIGRFFMPIQDLSGFWNSVQSALAAAERVFDIMDTPQGISDWQGAEEMPQIEGKITYEDLNFRYEDDTPVLKDINLVIEPNSTVALVGPTGVGKTTMINLLYRFYDPREGSVKVDGHDVKDIQLASLRKQMAVVLQDNFLFSGSIMDNIRYGNLEASDEEIIEVAQTVGAHEFIMKLPEGYETDVRERGGRLSVGQRQLISLARALMADPRILIMDEATSSIDAYTELIIQKALEKVFRNRTSIIIAHRLSTVRNSDMIVVLREGGIAEKGSHDELMEMDGLYKQLYEMQFKYESEEVEEK
ncbi:ABC transporter ATP-binding protein [Candidatus Bathyarchaeota archaeon]|nr:ABC transporter ATP-binding protein [Candidatus Bathyarchaeota archaeon]MBT4425124.1 ABC transporter ATP-binding protein [Candidatus Bathyarchaeota archaeon]MBT5641628.1 ABC transporter ATP-binding protein [Candidatus Bathyarchaeota archaeon]MBT6605901.1 ABC transporter ATP-binding protein [Candidatus Bathyarchaeota archaeon]